MRTHTSEFKTNIANLGREQAVEITYTISSVTITLTNEDIYSVTYSYSGSLLKSIMQCVEIETDNLIPVGTEISLKWGIKVGNAIEYLDFSNFIVKEYEKQEDSNTYIITCYDYMLKAMKDYEAMSITYPISVRDFLSAICTKLGITFKSASDNFANYNKQISNELYLDTDNKSLGYTFRDVLDEIAQVTASCIVIDKDNQLEVRYITATNDTIDENYLKDLNVNFGEKYGPINSIVLSRSDSDNVYLQDQQSITANGLTEIKIVDNQIMNWDDRSTYLQDILTKLDGIEYYLNDYVSTGIGYYEILDRYSVSIGSQTYSCVMLNDELDITQGIEENIHADMPESSETEYSYADSTDRKLNQTTLIVNKQKQQIQTIVSQIGDRSSKQTTITQDIENIEATIEDFEDLTRETTGIGTVSSSSDTISGGFLELHIYGNNTVFEYLYPADNLYPADDLYPLGSSKILVNNVSYELGIDDVLRQNGTTKDEYILDRDGARVIRRINTDGTIKTTPTTETLVAPTFQFVEGVNTISIVEYSASMKLTYVIKSALTNIFATTVDMKSSIKQSSNEIKATVEEKLEGVSDDDGYVTSGSIILAINDDESTATIQSDKIKLEGYTTINEAVSIDTDGYLHASKGGTLAGFNITDFGLQADGILIASGGGGGSIIRNLNLVYAEGTPEVYGSAITTVRGVDDNNASIFHMNRIGTDAGINVIGTDGVNFNLYTSTSDPQLKKNIKPTEVNGLETINQIEHIQFNWKKDDKFQANGYNAENLVEICEDFCDRVEQTGGEYETILNVKDFNIMPYITKAIQELSAKNIELENRIIELERRLNND